jgi:hypothetical protein
MNAEFADLRRRDLLKIVCLTGLSLAIPFTRLSKSDSSYGQEIKRSAAALGATVTVTVEEDFSLVKAQAAISDAFNEINRLEFILTRS